jgi:hypothetical protein
MPELATVNAATLALHQGALGVGEHHDNDNARHHLYEWMLNGLVQQVVLELDFNVLPLGPTLQVMGFIDNQWNNDIGLVDLFYLCQTLGIEIRGWDPGDQLGLTMGQNVTNRNTQVVASFVNQHAPGAPHNAVANAQGTVFLFGVGHFGANPTSLNMLLGDTLPWIDLH